MSRAADFIRSAPTEPTRPWPRHVLDTRAWRGMAATMAVDASLDLLALWADGRHVHALFRDDASRAILPASVAVAAGVYPALSPVRPAAAWFERMIRDRWGHAAEGGRDPRPWLDQTGGEAPSQGHLRFQAEGAGIVRLEIRAGRGQRGQLARMRGLPPAEAAHSVARLSADAAVAHSLAYARAVEAALGVEAPPCAHALRGVMTELERLTNHFADLSATTDIVGFALLPARFGFHRDAIVQAAERAFGERLMADCIAPGGMVGDMRAGGAEAIVRAVDAAAVELPRLTVLYEHSSGLAERVGGLGVVRPLLAARYGIGGVVGRAAGRQVDARRAPGYPPYAGRELSVAVRNEGDVDARLRVRMAEAVESCRLVRNLIVSLPRGPLAVALPAEDGEGIGVAEGFRGDIWHWVRLEAGRIADAFPRDTSWLQWPVLEAIGIGANLADFPLIETSFNCSYDGMEL